MFSDTSASLQSEPEVLLDGLPIQVPSARRSLAAIRSYLDTLALENQRVLCSLNVDGEPADLKESLAGNRSFRRVEGETLDLENMPLQLLKTAQQQAAQAQAQVQSAVVLVLINEGHIAREFWWDLSRRLKEPLLTLSLLPESSANIECGHATLAQLRKWQLQQLGAILKDVDEACGSEDSRALSNALENRALPWLDSLNASLSLWHETLFASSHQLQDR
jgi:hypothetical protein